MINLILFGPPGSGKGTQAVKLVEKYNLLHISTGDLFRYEMSNDTPLGLKAKEFISKGELVPDSITIGMLENKMNANQDVKGFILDGFPRTLAQADALDTFLKEKNQAITSLLQVNVDDETLVARLLERGKTSGRADDQNPETIQNRLNVYKTETAPVAGHYAKQGKTFKINGLGDIEIVFRRLCDNIDG